MSVTVGFFVATTVAFFTLIVQVSVFFVLFFLNLYQTVAFSFVVPTLTPLIFALYLPLFLTVAIFLLVTL